MAIENVLEEIQIQRKQYFIEHFLQSLKSNQALEFHSTPICGLLELSRQFVVMPPGIRELSAENIKASILQIIEHTNNLYKFSNHIPIKEMKNLFTTLTLVKEIRTIAYIETIYNTLSDYSCYIGHIKTLQYVIKKKITENNYDEILLIDEIIHFLAEYLENRGNTLSEIYAICNNWFRQYPDNTNFVFDKIITHLKEIGISDLTKLPTINCSINITYKDGKSENIKAYITKILSFLQNEKRIHKVVFIEHERKLNVRFKLFKIDGLYVERVLNDIHEKIHTFNIRTNYIEVFKVKKQRKHIIPLSKTAQDNLNIKHFNSLWRSTDFLTVDPYVYQEMSKLNEWIQVFENSKDKRTSFLVLWSILEFMLVHSVQDNKIQSVCTNFIPYMGLFNFRKINKTFFKKISTLHSSDHKESAKILSEYISKRLADEGIDTSNLTIADQTCIFLFYKTFKNKWWDSIDFKYASKNYINQLTTKNQKLVLNYGKTLHQLDIVLNNDINQMYRLRNMLSHSGVNDSKILNDTYFRLKYYVETLINAVSYTWLYGNPKSPATLMEINDFKRADFNVYKKSLDKIIKTTNQENKPTELLKVMKFNGLTTIPPNRFSFLGYLEKNIDLN